MKLKEYKLIKKLPFNNSPEIGYISKQKYFGDKQHYWNSSWFNPEEHKEFWEEITEKEYEVLSLIKNNEYCFLDKDNLFKYKNFLGTKIGSLLEQCISVGWNIHSVKRLSDDEVFTIGDKVIGNLTNIRYNISSFVIDKRFDKIIINEEDFHLNECKKAKQPLFTTEDGVDIFKGDIVYYVETEEEPELCFIVNKYTVLKHSSRFTSDKSLHSFSTKEKAEEYIFLNKPVLCLQDIINTNSYAPFFMENIEKIVTEKLKL